MQVLLTHLLRIQREVETAKRPTRDFLIILGKVVNTFLQRTSRPAQGDSSLCHVRNGLTIATSIELMMSVKDLTPDEERDVGDLLNTINARIAEFMHGSPSRMAETKLAEAERGNKQRRSSLTVRV